jgi:hypothetical protein
MSNTTQKNEELELMKSISEMYFERAKAAVDQGGLDTMDGAVQREMLTSQIARMTFEISKRLERIIDLLENKDTPLS